MDGVKRIPLAQLSAPRDQHVLGPRAVATLPWFVAGPENALACAAAEAVLRHACDPTIAALGPIVFCGPPGVGKSHLVWGLVARGESSTQDASRAQQLTPPAIRVVAAADITNDEELARRPRQAADQRSRSAAELDLLIVEDLGDLRDRPIAQQQLTYHLDEIAAHGGLAVITCRESPAESRELLPSLRSRLVGGLLTPIAPPAAEARRALLADWAALLGISMTDDAAEVLAAGLAYSPPQLRGAIVSLAFAGQGRVPNIDAGAAGEYVAAHGTAGPIDLRTVAAKAARYFGLTLADLKSSSRQRSVVEARGIAMFLARRLTGLSFERIGTYFGGRDHTTVLYNFHRTEELHAADPATRHAVTSLEESLAHCARRKRCARSQPCARSPRRRSAPPIAKTVENLSPA